jgi:type II secretory pathway component PulJ|tara:strand:- start:1227 stop:1670 length:444 start_codon:yes stop_codon:yes gene_type:complete
MNLVRIPTSNIDDVWNLVKKDIQDALSYSGNHTDANFVYETLKSEHFQLWVVWDAKQSSTIEKYFGVVVTEVVERKLKKSCNLFIVTGRHRQKWQHLINVLEDFALENDCQNMELIARQGWEKIMKKYNYKRTHVVLEKPIIKKENI